MAKMQISFWLVLRHDKYIENPRDLDYWYYIGSKITHSWYCSLGKSNAAAYSFHAAAMAADRGADD